MNICVIIPAAGNSERFGPGNKLEQDLGGRALLMRTVELFTKRDEVQAIIVAAPPNDLDAFKAKHGASLSFHGVTIVAGGRQDRWETVRNALEAVPAECTHIAVHDAARPATSKEVMDRLFEAARSLAAVVPGVPISATVKRVAGEGVDVSDDEDAALVDAILGDAGRRSVEARPVTETVDRTGLYEIQTPQVFESALLRRAYAQPDLSGATDDAGLVERLGEPVHVVKGDARNLKVTTPEDLKLVRAVLGVKGTAERPAHKRF